MEMTIRPMTAPERMYCYSQSQQIMAQTGCIGHLRGDMGSSGEQFFPSWDDHQGQLKTQEFKDEFDTVSAGIISVVVSLVHDAQEIAILSGKECLNLETLNIAYQQRLSLLHGYIEPAITKKPQTTTTKQNAPATKASANTAIENENIISQLVTLAKNQQLDLLPMLKDYMPIVEVSI